MRNEYNFLTSGCGITSDNNFHKISNLDIIAGYGMHLN